MRVRVPGKQLSKDRSRSRRSATTRCIRILPLLCILIIVTALGILAVSEITLMGKRNPPLVGSGGAASRIMPGRVHIRPTQKKIRPPVSGKGKVFRVEPLLRRNAPSLELTAMATVNRLQGSRVAGIIQIEGSYRAADQGARSFCSPPPVDCPPVPPDLKGTINVTKWSVSPDPVDVSPGGWSTPGCCTSRHAVAIVIPFRDRESQLVVLMKYLHPILQRQQLNYRIFVVEQIGNDTFNKGVLMNAGFLTALKYPIYPGVVYHCFVFHDVDMLMEDDRNIYSCPQQPRHLSVAVNELNYRLPYRELVGGVFAIRTDHFFRVNGYSNLYWGWGGEDDDMGYRVEHVLFSISRPPEWIARYTMIKHEKRRPLAYKVRVRLTRTSWRRYRLDGLNTVQYKLAGLKETPSYTHLLVDVGHPPENIRAIQQEEEG